MKTKYFGAFDYFRIIAASLVIFIHAPAVPFLGDTGNLLLSGTFARIAVPFFFAVTGFLTDFSSADAIKKLVKKTALMYIAATAVYLPYGSYFASIKQILFDGTFYHLWYFPAAAMGAVIVFWLKKLPTVPAVVIASLLYTFGLCGDSYRVLAKNIEPLSKTLDVLSNVFSFTRNGLFFAPMFLLLGSVLGEKTCFALAEKSSPIGVFIAIPCFVMSLAMLISERLLLKEITFSPNDNMFISLVPCTIFLLLILSAIRLKPRPILRQISMWIYIVHPIIIDLINRITNGFDETTGMLGEDALRVIFSASISLAIAAVFGILFSVKKAKNARIA